MTRYAPLWQQNSPYPAQTDRTLLAALWPTSGSLTRSALTAPASTMNVQIGPGQAAVALAAGNYTALCRWDANEIVTLAAAPASGQSRIDLVVLQVRDAALDAGSNNDFIFSAVTGTAAVSNPATPATPTNAYPVATVAVAGGVASITTGNITDAQVTLVGASGLAPVASAQRTADSGQVANTPLVMPGLSVTIAVPAGGHRVRLTTCWTITNTGGPSLLRASHREGATQVSGAFASIVSNGFAAMTFGAVLTPGAGAHTYDTYLSTDVGTANVSASATQPSWTLVEDLGP
jgi:hypothetical protein